MFETPQNGAPPEEDPATSVDEEVEPSGEAEDPLARAERERDDGGECDQSEAHHGHSTARSRNRIYPPRSSAPNRSASASTIFARSPPASSSESVRSADWKTSESATDFLPSPTCSPR